MTQRRASSARGTGMVVIAGAAQQQRPGPRLVTFCVLLLLLLFLEQCVTDAFLLPSPHLTVNSRAAASSSHVAVRIRLLSSRGPLYRRTTSAQTIANQQRRRPASESSTSSRHRSWAFPLHKQKSNAIENANHDDTPNDFNHSKRRSLQFGKQDPDGRSSSTIGSTSISLSSSIQPKRKLIPRLCLVASWFVSALLLGKSAAHARAEIRTVYASSSSSAVGASTRSGWILENSLQAQGGGLTTSPTEPVQSALRALESWIQSTFGAIFGLPAVIFSSVASVFGAVLSPFQSLWTSIADTKARSLLTTVSRHRRRVLWTVLALLTARALVQQRRTRRRQVQDATSEWSRYARHPAARGRAIGTLLTVKLLPLLLGMRIVSRRGSRRRDRLQQRAGRVFADNLLQLGPLYIKLGQILSCREKFLPEQWKDALERLQDEVPSQSGERAQQLAYEAWPGGKNSFHETFVDMDWTPVAAASLGQVHTAKLKSTGEPVALKLQRPYLREIYDQDFALLTKIASIVDKYFGSSAGSVGGVQQNWTDIFEDAEEILYREIDYRDEAENAIRWYKAFGLTKGGKPASKTEAESLDGKPLPSAAPWLRTPFVYDELSTEKVLVMENVPSIKITNSAKLDAANVTALDREYLADCLGRSYLRQFCCNKFFSTDPHAGNLGVEVLNMESSVQEERVRLVYYDFGQAAELQQNQADGILEIIEAIVDMDVDRSIESFQKMDVLKEGADLSVVRAKVADNYRTGKVKANRKKLRKRGYKFKVEAASSSNSTNSSNTTTTTSRGSDSAVMQYFTLPAEYAFVARALSQMDGVGKSLDPEFDFVSSAAPWIVEIKGAGLYVKDEALKWITSIRDYIGMPKSGRNISKKHHGDPKQQQSILVPPLQTAVALALVFLVSATRFITGAEESDS